MYVGVAYLYTYMQACISNKPLSCMHYFAQEGEGEVGLEDWNYTNREAFWQNAKIKTTFHELN